MIHRIISDLRDNSSTLNKQAILQANKDNTTLKRAFELTESPIYNFYLKVDLNTHRNHASAISLSVGLLDEIKRKLHDRELTGNAARDWVESVLCSLSAEDASVVARMINRDLDCKTGTAILNKVWKGLIPEMPCMLASKMDSKIAASIVFKENGYIVQRKCDGGRAMIVVSNDGDVTVLSRNGKPIETHGIFDAMFAKYPGFVFDGELLVVSDIGVEDRKTGNGFFTKAVRGTITPNEAARFSYVVWDMIPLADFYNGFSLTPYKTRLRNLMDVIQTVIPGRVSLVESEFISSLGEAQRYYNQMIERGEEGAIIKFANSPWEDKRSKFMIKLKEEKDCDALVIGVTPHTKKSGWIGSLTCKTRDGVVVFDVGSGFTEEDRQRSSKDFLDKIVEIKYNSLITSKGKDTYSLFLPVFVKIRDDKTVANSYEELL